MTMLHKGDFGAFISEFWPPIAFLAFWLICFVTLLSMNIKSSVNWLKRIFMGGDKRGRLKATVAARSFGYLAEDPSRARYFTGSPFGFAFASRACDIVWGKVDGRPFETFAYLDQGASTQYGKTTAQFSWGPLARLDTPQNAERVFQITWVPLPGPIVKMRFEPDSAAWRALSSLGASDIDVESVEFNRLWKVSCADSRVGHAILTPRMIQRFLQPDVRGKVVTFEGSAVWMAAAEGSDLSDIDDVVAQLYSIADLIPRFLFGDRSGDTIAAADAVTTNAFPAAPGLLGWTPTINPFLAQRDFGYLAKSPERARYFHTPPLWYGGYGPAEDVVWGKVGGVAFERYTRDVTAVGGDGGGVPTGLLANRGDTPQSFRVTWLPLRASLPAVRITSGNALRNGEVWLGAHDVTVESNDFNERWAVKCVDERVAHALLTPPMIERFLRPDIQGHSFIIEGAAIVHYEIGSTDYSDIDEIVTLLDSVARLIPAFVLE